MKTVALLSALALTSLCLLNVTHADEKQALEQATARTALELVHENATGTYALALAAVQPAAQENVTMLGVHVRRPDGTLRRHLKINPGMGLVVESVVENSAASKAGIAVDDVLLKLGDQWLVNEEQLTTLVRNRAVGDQVTISLVRDGSQQNVEVTLAQGTASADGQQFSPMTLYQLGVGEYSLHWVPDTNNGVIGIKHALAPTGAVTDKDKGDRAPEANESKPNAE